MDKTTTSSVRLSFSEHVANHQIARPFRHESLAVFRARSLIEGPTQEIRILGCQLLPSRYFRFLELLEQNGNCWTFTGPRTHNGYGSFGVGGRQSKNLRAHKLAYTLWKDIVPEDLQCLHIQDCKFRSCCWPFHLYTGTAKQNTEDMMEKGTHKYKLVNKVTHEMAELMRYYKDRGYSLIQIGDILGVSNETVRVYLNGTAQVGTPRIVTNG